MEEFVEQYQLPNKPVIIEGLADDWPAMEKWNFKQLYQDYGDVEFEVGEDQEGEPVTVKFKDYIQYMIFNQDDAPFYLFQRDLSGHRNPSEDVSVPEQTTSQNPTI